MLVPVPFAVPDDLAPFDKLIPFVSSTSDWESLSPNESDDRDAMDTEETHLSCPPNAYSDGTY